MIKIEGPGDLQNQLSVSGADRCDMLQALLNKPITGCGRDNDIFAVCAAFDQYFQLLFSTNPAFLVSGWASRQYDPAPDLFTSVINVHTIVFRRGDDELVKQFPVLTSNSRQIAAR